MKLIILDELALKSYELPSSQKTFNINYRNEIITVNKQNDKWFLSSSKNMDISLNGQLVDKVELNDYTIFTIHHKVVNKEVTVIASPGIDKYSVCSITELSEVTIGMSNNTTIQYGDGLIKDPHASIKIANDTGVITAAENALVYVNNKAIKSQTLKLGDVIFIYGLRIIWMGNFIKVNNPSNKVTLNGLQASNLVFQEADKYTKVTESERNTKLYDESQLFFHTPTQSTFIKNVDIHIETPPDKEKYESLPIIFTLGTSMVVAASAGMSGINAVRNMMAGEGDKLTNYLEIGIAGLMLFSCIFMPILLDLYQKHVSNKKERLRQKRYKKYLETKKNEIDLAIKSQSNILNDKHLPIDKVEKQMLSKGYAFWSREIIDPDFLSVRLGVGNVPASLHVGANLEEFNLYDDNLKDMVADMVNKNYELPNVPISISLLNNRITPIVNETNKVYEYINTIMLQLLFYYSSIDLKIVLITKEENKDKWDYLKYTTHNWNANHDKRLFAVDENEINQLSMYLEQEYKRRIEVTSVYQADDNNDINKNELYKKFDDYYLIVTDDYNSIKSIPFINKVINSGVNLGFSLLVFANSIKNIPSRLDKFVVIRDEISGLFDKNVIDGTNVSFRADYLSNNDIAAYSRVAANIPVASHDVESSIPTSLGFLEMYNVGKIEHLNITTRWKDNDPTTSLNAPLGMQKNHKLIGLDLHEKAHGPHGLIAGSTGSGKSEFIMTLILSLAINYHPYEVQFVLIDYKGGGLAGAFEKRDKNIKIPHLVGTITNLDKSEMHRTLVSIKSELERRQRVFNEARDVAGGGTIDIYKYQRLYREGKVSEPMAHLIIISDEFAELKQQQPEFMDELVSTARIGRSLGVHLILATQKPAGVVNDQIWSNSRFKVCLKVQSSEDSVEVLKRDDASKIKEAGRFYLQVGNDEIFELGQSAWSGEKYVPKDVILSKVNDSIDFVNNEGTIIKSVVDEVKSDKVDCGDQLSNIVDYLYQTAVNENIEFKNLWLPNIPEFIYLGNLFRKYAFRPQQFKFEGIVGEYDKPAKQEQGLFKLNINHSNTMVFGSTGSGKELLATTFIYSLCVAHTLQELNMYIIDFGSEVLRPFERMPHVGNYITSDEPKKVATLFLYLEKQIKKRKDLFADYRGDFDYYNLKSPTKAPLILTVINAYEAFMENCEEYNDYLVHLLREGSKYGIVFLITTVSTNSVRSTTLEYFENKMILKTADPYDYQYILGAPMGLIPGSQYGRGIGMVEDEACEFQTAYINLKDDINETIRQTCNKYLDLYKAKVRSIKVMPKSTTLETLQKDVKSVTEVPVGFEIETAEMIKYNFTNKKINVITGEEVINNISFLGTIIDLMDTIPNIKINLFDIASCISFEGNATYYNVDYVEPFNEILSNQATQPTINFLLGFSVADGLLNEDEYVLYKKILLNAEQLNNQYFILVDNIERVQELQDEDILSVIDHNNGIYFGDDIDRNKVFNVANISQIDPLAKIDNKTYVIINGNALTLKGVGVEGEEED